VGAEKSGKLESSQAEVKQYLRETHSDLLREDPLGNISSRRHIWETVKGLHTFHPLDMSTHDIKTYQRLLVQTFHPIF